jgi:hypothetical protein
MRTLQLRQLNDDTRKCGDIPISLASIAGEGRGGVTAIVTMGATTAMILAAIVSSAIRR